MLVFPERRRLHSSDHATRWPHHGRVGHVDRPAVSRTNEAVVGWRARRERANQEGQVPEHGPHSVRGTCRDYCIRERVPAATKVTVFLHSFDNLGLLMRLKPMASRKPAGPPEDNPQATPARVGCESATARSRSAAASRRARSSSRSCGQRLPNRRSGARPFVLPCHVPLASAPVSG